jgi:copper ion binding protein
MEKLTLKVPDMSCGHCVSAVSGAVGKLPGVSDVEVDLEAKRVEVAGQRLEQGAIVAAVREAGYEPVGS